MSQACLEVYGLVRREGRLADRALEHALRHKRHLYSSERRSVAERIYALLRRQRTVDFLLDQLLPGLAASGASRHDLLRLSAARVLSGEDPGQVARASMLQGKEASALENLPAALGRLSSLPPPTRLAILGSIPDFLADRLLTELGADAEAVAAAMNERAPLTARLNTLKGDREGLIQRLSAEGVGARPTTFSPLGVHLDGHQNAFSLGCFKEGWFELQDEGSQLLGMLVDPPPTKVIDACAGAGGKTLQLSAEMKNRGDLFALDVDEHRLSELKRRARRAGVHNVRIRTIPPLGPSAGEAIADLSGRADRVLVDAPCSGTGTFRRKPDARYRLNEENLALHVDRQRQLLMLYADLVKPGGRLIYGTCSLLTEENEAVVEGFLGLRSDYEVLPISKVLGEEASEPIRKGPYLRLYPHRHGTDGFFGAILGRKSANPAKVR